MTLRSAHADFSWVVVFANAAVGLWALAAHRDARFGGRWLWRATVVAQITMIAQVCLGVALVAVEHHEVDSFHALYGFSGFASVGILYSYRHQLKDRLHLLYGLGGLWMMGLAIRAMTLNPVPRR